MLIDENTRGVCVCVYIIVLYVYKYFGVVYIIDRVYGTFILLCVYNHL